MTKEAFIELVTADQPDAPAYFTYDAVLNTQGAADARRDARARAEADELERVLALAPSGAQMLDTRDPAEFAAAHSRAASTSASAASTPRGAARSLSRSADRDLIADPGRENEAATRLGRIGFDSVAGYLRGGMEAT